VWTPKRILILLGGTLLFTAAFVVYSLFLGGIDGLPTLPPEYARPDPDEETQPLVIQPGDTDRKIALAFGTDSEEAKRKFTLDLGSRNVMIAFDEVYIEQDGRVKLTTFSAALFPKNRREEYPEINTVHCEIAFLTLDKAVSNFTEISNRRVIGIELRGSRGVTFLNNRRTPEKHDDIELRITTAPVYYEERSHKIWTDGFVKLLDQQSQPNPTEITAKGMELHLIKDEGPAKTTKAPTKTKADKSRGEQVNGVELLVLKSHVDMHLYVDAKNGFLAGAQDFGTGQPRPAAASAPEKSHIIIKTKGPFRYEIPRELARFESPAVPAGSAVAETVMVSREHKVGNARKFDQLDCDSLELHFRRIEGPGRTSTNNKEIDTALATARPGKEVILTMDSENLEAYGSRLFYRSATDTSGPQTILEGQPLHAIREGHKILARELHLIGPDKKGNGQQAFAKGPGRIDMLSKSDAHRGDDKPAYTLHAIWQDSLISTKDRDGDRVFDLLTFTGDAAFIDDEHQQTLTAQRLQVWLEQLQTAGENKQKAGNAPRQKPHRMEAYDQVHLHSPDIVVEKCHKLVVCFKEMASAEDQLPDALLVVSPKKEARQAKDGPEVRTAGPVALPKEAKGDPRPELPGQAATEKEKPRKPIKLSANEVVAYVAVQGSKKQLQEVVTEGNVHVSQEGETPKDKGVDITGEMLNLVYHPLGNTLYVFGDSRQAAQLQLGDLYLTGPKVTIDQKDNMAEVEGIGAMRLPSNTTFEGGKPAKEGTTVTIYWNKDMVFNGKFAEFHGGVQAVQDSAHLKCQTLQVTLDRVVSFKEGQKADQNAKVEKLLCDQKVFLEERIVGPDGKLKSYKRLQGASLAMDNQDGPINAPGPGTVRYVSPGGGNMGLSPSATAKPEPIRPPAKDQPLRLTRIDFERRMYAHNKLPARTAIFYDNVEVYNQPGDDPDVKVLPNQPPKDGFYMRCDTLHVTTQEADKKTTQNMVAKGNVFFRTPEFYGQADTIKYDEGQDLIIFEGSSQAPASLYKLGPQGSEPQVTRGSKILYNRRTGEIGLAGGTVISTQ
jgi:lipopolysaccharide export system protein LptA